MLRRTMIEKSGLTAHTSVSPLRIIGVGESDHFLRPQLYYNLPLLPDSLRLLGSKWQVMLRRRGFPCPYGSCHSVGVYPLFFTWLSKFCVRLTPILKSRYQSTGSDSPTIKIGTQRPLLIISTPATDISSGRCRLQTRALRVRKLLVLSLSEWDFPPVSAVPYPCTQR